MKFGFKHVAVAAVLAFGAMSTTPATVQAQTLSQQAVAAANGPNALATLNALMANNPAAAAAIASAAAAANSGLAAGLATRLATVVSASSLSDADKAAQIQSGAQGLAAANEGAAVEIFNNMAAAAPAFASNASTGAQQGAPNQVAGIVAAFSTAGGGGGGGGGDGGGGDGDGDGDGGETSPGSLS